MVNMYLRSVFVDDCQLPKYIFVTWREIDGAVKVVERGPIEVIVLEKRRGEKRIEVVKVNDVEYVVKQSHGSVSALMKGVPGVTRSSSVIWVSNWTQEE
ncbi:MAG: hypothetical protein QW330_01525 [Nitrososphaerota archaeon]